MQVDLYFLFAQSNLGSPTVDIICFKAVGGSEFRAPFIVRYAIWLRSMPADVSTSAPNSV